jgi:hypothetical protein
MYLDKDSFIMDEINMGQYLTEVEFAYNKLWANDSGRNLAGTQSGTLIGIFPKFKLSFRKLTKEELQLIAPILDKATQNTTYDDPVKGKITISTYTGDWSTLNRSTFSNVVKANEPFSISVISRKKRV